VAFRRTLGSLVERTKGARGAVFCDCEGEFVELVTADPQLSDYDMRVFGAQVAAAWLNLHNGASERGAGGIVEMKIHCAQGTLLCRNLRDGYYLVLLLARGFPSSAAAFELKLAAAEVASELEI
jgi:predicted regulator of Ras-like GTPase activity (Roadblock/LC7/MglB family)